MRKLLTGVLTAAALVLPVAAVSGCHRCPTDATVYRTNGC